MSLYRKYRSQKFEDLIGENHVRDTLLLAIREDRVGHGYLFAGPRGIGKTSVARLLAKAVNCQKREELNKAGSGEPCGECSSCKEIAANKNLDIIEIDAASNRGIDEIRDLRDKVKFAPTSAKFKVFIIDEVHMLTMPAFNALLKTLEEPPKHAIFILATTEAHKIPATILSRVQRFDFRRISKSDIVKNLKIIAEKEGLKATDEALEAIAVVADGSHRDSISLFEQVSSLTKEITLVEVSSVLGLAKSEEALRLIELIFAGKSSEAISIVSEFIDSGVEASQIIVSIVSALRSLLLLKISNNEVELDLTKEMTEKLGKVAGNIPARKLNKTLGIFIEAGQLLKDSPVRTLPIEMAIIESAELVQVTSNKEQDTNKSEIQNPNDETNSKPEIKKEKIIEEKKPEKQAAILTRAEESSIQNNAPSQGHSVDFKSDQDDKAQASVNNEASEPSENVPTKPLDEESWKNVLEKVKEQNHSLNALLRDAKPEGIEGDVFHVSVKFKFHHDKISEIKNKDILENAITEITGQKYIVKCQIKEKSKAQNPKSKDEAEQTEDLEKAAKEMFETE